MQSTTDYIDCIHKHKRGPLTKYEGDLQSLLEVKENAVSWLESSVNRALAK